MTEYVRCPLAVEATTKPLLAAPTLRLHPRSGPPIDIEMTPDSTDGTRWRVDGDEPFDGSYEVLITENVPPST